MPRTWLNLLLLPSWNSWWFYKYLGICVLSEVWQDSAVCPCARPLHLCTACPSPCVYTIYRPTMCRSSTRLKPHISPVSNWARSMTPWEDTLYIWTDLAVHSGRTPWWFKKHAHQVALSYPFLSVLLPCISQPFMPKVRVPLLFLSEFIMPK